MDFPRSNDEKRTLLKSMFLAQIFKVIQGDQKLSSSWRSCLDHPSLQFDIEIELAAGQGQADSFRNESYPDLRGFVNALPAKVWENAPPSLVTLREMVKQGCKNLHIVPVLRTKPKPERKETTELVLAAPSEQPTKAWEINTNDKRLLRHLGIAYDDETPSS